MEVSESEIERSLVVTGYFKKNQIGGGETDG